MSTNANNYVISYFSLRKLIGNLAIFLPVMCWGANAVVNNFDLLNNPYLVDESQSETYLAAGNLKSSVSHFYYTAAGPLFVGISITVSIFLFCYIGYKPDKVHDRFSWLTDNRITSFAAVCLLLVIIFPTGSDTKITDNVHIFVSSKVAGGLHLFCAALFFLSMAVLSIINFRRHPNKVLIKDTEGVLYLICGWGIVGCLVILGFILIVSKHAPQYFTWLPYCFVFIMEMIMLILFGTAWLIKGKSKPTESMLRKFSKTKSPAKNVIPE